MALETGNKEMRMRPPHWRTQDRRTNRLRSMGSTGTVSAGGGSPAFTLIELLVSIAVVVILAAILWVGIRSVRQTALTAQNVSNIRQTASVHLLRIQSEGGVIDTFAGGVHPRGRHWSEQLIRGGFLERGDREILFSPAKIDAVDLDGYNWEWRTYGLNLFQDVEIRNGVNGGNLRRFRMNAVEDPSNYLLFADTLSCPGCSLGRFRILGPNTEDGGIHLANGNTAVIALLDGSVEQAGPRRLKNLGFNAVLVGPEGRRAQLGELIDDSAQ